jgi:glycerophosphoryl diester phosphodiesterase
MQQAVDSSRTTGYTIIMRTPLVIAHRGNSFITLENSLAAIRSALSLHVNMIEIDIRMSRDNGLYVMHDKTTGRTAEENIDIEQSTSEKINAILLKNGEPIPSLADMLALIDGSCGLNLEIKSTGAGALTAQHLLASEYRGHVLVSSFKEDEVLAAHGVLPGLPISLIFDTFAAREVTKYKARGYTAISLSKKTVSKKLVDACHDQRIPVYVWTVDDEEEMKIYIEWGVDGIFSNKPGVLKEVINKLQTANNK